MLSMISWVACILIPTPAAILLWHFCCNLRHNARFANIPGPRGIGWGGAFAWLVDPNRGWDFFDLVDKNYGGLVKLSTPFGCKDMLYISDPLALLHVTRKDEDNFGQPMDLRLMFQLIMGDMSVGTTSGVKHARQMRHLNALFLPSRLRLLPTIFYGVTERLLSSLRQLTVDGPAVIDMSHWGNRTTFELVGQSILGHSFDTLKVGDEPNLYGDELKAGFAALSTSGSQLALKYVLPLVASLSTPEFNQWLLTLVPHKTVRMISKFIEDLATTSKQLYEEKKSSIMRKSAADGNDLASYMIQELVLTPQKISDREATSHLRTLLFAATDTTSSAILRTLFVLAHQPDVQARLRQEINDARNTSGDDLDYDTLMKLPFLNAVYLETMRLYPPSNYVHRAVLKDTVLPLAYPIKGTDGSTISEVLIREGTTITLSLIGVNRHKGVWGPDAEEWKPDRWLKVDSDGKGAVKDDRMPGISSRIMSFLDGKNHCVGWRFVQVELKLVISELVHSFVFSPAPGLDEQIHWPVSFILSPFMGDKMGMPLMVSPL